MVTEFAALEALSGEWERLHAATGKAEIFQDFRWVQAWWRKLGDRGRLFTPIAYRGARLVAILPLVLEHRRLRFIGHSVSDYNHFLAHGDEGSTLLASCLDCLQVHAIHWDEILLDNVPESSYLAQCIEHLPAHWQRSVVKEVGDVCPTLVLNQDGADTLKAPMRKLRRAINRLSRHGKLCFRHLEDPIEAANHLEDFFKQHVRRSALAGRRSRFLEPDYASFYQALLEQLSPEKEIRFSVLELDGRPIAYHFGSLYHGKYLWYKPSFDVELWDVAPGQALLWYLFDHLHTAEVREFDFGRGDEAFKQRFANQLRQNLNFTIYASRYRSVPRRAYRWLHRSTREHIRTAPRAERALQAIAGTFRELSIACRQAEAKVVLRKLIAYSFVGREQWWLLSIESFSAGPTARVVCLEHTSLGGIADLAAGHPEDFTREQLTEARQLLHEDKTPWIASLSGVPQALMWTSFDRELTLPAGGIRLPDNAMLIVDTWPLTRHTTLMPVILLQAFARSAADKGLKLFALCSKHVLPSERFLRKQGIGLQYRWVKMRMPVSRAGTNEPSFEHMASPTLAGRSRLAACHRQQVPVRALSKTGSWDADKIEHRIDSPKALDDRSMPMRIVHLIDNLDYGGAEQLVASLAANQAKRGHCVQVVCLRDLGPCPVGLSELDMAGVKIVTLEKPPGFHLGTLRKLARHLSHDRPDVVHAHNHLVHHYGAIAARWAGTPVVLNTVHGSASLNMPASAKALFWASCMISDRAVSVCRQVDSTLRDSLHIPARKRCVIENGAELATFLSVSRNPSADTVTFGNIGRLEPVKDHETLLKAFSIVRKKHPHVKLRLLGDGSLRQQLETLAANLSVADDVRFEGFSLDTARFLATIDIYVIPSRSEGLPLTLLEAMAAALPVVSAAVGAIPEVLAKTRCAWTCPPADPDSLASAMEQAMHTPGLGTIGLRNRQVVQVDYAIERMDRDYEHLYRTLLSA